MPVKNVGESDAEGDVSNAESEHSNSSQNHESSDEEANEIDSDDSSEMDAVEIERRRNECLEILDHLEKQFSQLREQYYTERINQIERQSAEVRNGRSEEYLQPLKELDKVYKNRIEVAEILKRYRLENIEHKYLSEEQAALQNFESEKQLALDQIYDDLMEKIRRLEEDRHNVDISWDDWGSDKRSKVRGPARKKAVTVSGPFIVYMLHEEDILEDWTTIRKALKRSTVVGPRDKQLALDQTYDDLMDKMRRLEEDCHNMNISWDNWSSDKSSKVRQPARKEAVTVSGPFIVYMLHDEDILEDWTTIRNALNRSTWSDG